MYIIDSSLMCDVFMFHCERSSFSLLSFDVFISRTFVFRLGTCTWTVSGCACGFCGDPSGSFCRSPATRRARLSLCKSLLRVNCTPASTTDTPAVWNKKKVKVRPFVFVLFHLRLSSSTPVEYPSSTPGATLAVPNPSGSLSVFTLTFRL